MRRHPPSVTVSCYGDSLTGEKIEIITEIKTPKTPEWEGLTCARCLSAEHSSWVITWSSSTRWVPFKAAEVCTSCTPSYSRGPPSHAREHGHKQRSHWLWPLSRRRLPSLNWATALTFFFSEIGTYSIQPSVLEGILKEHDREHVFNMCRSPQTNENQLVFNLTLSSRLFPLCCSSNSTKSENKYISNLTRMQNKIALLGSGHRASLFTEKTVDRIRARHLLPCSAPVRENWTSYHIQQICALLATSGLAYK